GGPTIAYRSIGSGAGFKEWSEKELFSTVGFIGTDNTVNASEKALVEGKGTGEVLTIPVMQSAVSVVVNLPTGCTATSKAAAGRLSLNQDTLEGIYRGTIQTWGEVAPAPGTGNELKGAECGTKEIIPIVRLDGSGTTHIFKKFLNLTNAGNIASSDGKE